MYSWSVIKVKFRGSLRGGYGHDGSWGRWQILFNGSHCSDPGWIESLNYNSESDTSHHKSTGSKPLTVISCSSHPLYTHPAIRLSFLPSPSLYPSSYLSILPPLTLSIPVQPSIYPSYPHPVSPPPLHTAVFLSFSMPDQIG